MTFQGRVLLEVPDDDAGVFVLATDLRYQGNRELFTVPAGMHTDLGSVPPILWWLVRPYGQRATRCYLLHDALVRDPTLGRHDADGLLERALVDQGVPRLRARLTWAAVRLASGMSGATRRDWCRVLAILPVAILLLSPTLLTWPATVLLRTLERVTR